MNIYPYNSPIILNDAIFVNNGGQTGTSTPAQRQNAFLISEQQATSYIGAFLLPTIVTGTWAYAPQIVTDYGYVSRILSVGTLSARVSQSCTLESGSACVFVRHDTYGYLDVACLQSSYSCFGQPIPYQVQAAYESGLPTGTANQPAILLALTIAAQISLNEMYYPSQNEGTGDVGIEEFGSMDYRERRVKMGRTAFGSSAKAYKAAQLIRSTIRLARPTLRIR